MIKERNDCVGCGDLPCWGDACPLRHQEYCVCDYCGKEIDEDDCWKSDGEDLCWKCAVEKGLIKEEE